MELLRSILQLPFYILQKGWEIIRYFIVFLFYLIKAIFWLFSPIIGEINWSTPSWLPKAKAIYNTIGNALNKRKLLIGSTIILGTLTYMGANYAYHWYLNRPQPIIPAPIVKQNYSVRITAPNRSYDQLTLHFVGDIRSPAPLDKVNKEITEGITITPQIEGTWKWSDDRTITFKPNVAYWPLGAEYNITLDDSKLLAENSYLLGDLPGITFTTPSFNYSLGYQGKLYSDPTQDNVRNVLYTVYFSHTVDKPTFEKNIKLAMYEDGVDYHQDKFLNNIDFTIAYEQDDTIAHIKSSPVPFLEKPGYAKLTIMEGVSSTMGGKPVESIANSKVAIPDKYNLGIINADVKLVEESNEKIQQVLIVSLTHPVKSEDLTKVVKVWQLSESTSNYEHHYYYDEITRRNQSIFKVPEKELEKAKPIEIKPIATEHAYQTVLSFKIDADQKSKLYIEVNQPLSAQNGYFLKNNYRHILTVPEYPKLVDFAASGSLLSLSGEKKIALLSRNFSNLRLEIDRVIPSQLQHLISFNQSYDFEDMDFGEMDNDHFVEKYTVRKEVKGSLQAITQTEVDLSKYLTANNKDRKNRGVFLLRAYGDDYDGDRFMSSRFMVVTDLGIIAKKSLDKSYDLFIQSIASGAPVSNAKVTVMGMNGVAITSKKTDHTGHVKFSALSEYYRGIKPLLFVVEKDRDLSFLPISSYDRDLNLSRFDIGGIVETIKGGELRSHIFSDRGVYRPGDTFHIGTIVRAQNWANSLTGITLEAEIYDAQSNLVLKKPIVLDKSGFNELSYKTNYSSPTGDWYIYLYLKDDNEDERILLGTSSIVIREFEPDKTTVSLKLLPDIKQGWVKPEQLQAEITAKNLIGTDAADRRVTNSVILEPSYPHFKKYEDYSFYESISAHRKSFKVELDEEETDENGQVKIDLHKNMESFEGNYMLKMLTEVFEPDSGRSVAATATTFVSPSDYIVGAKSDGNLSYINKDSDRYLDIIAINPILEKIELSDLTLSVTEQKYVSILVKQPSNTYQFESRLKESVISEQPFAINKDKTIYQLDTQNPGNYIIQIMDKDNQLLYKTRYTVVGNSNVTRQLDRNAELELKINKTQFNPGDEIEIAINAPYVGSGIITIERDKVYAWKWFHTNTTSSVQKIKLPKNMSGNGYINVQFIRDPNSDEIFMSPLSYGVIPFKITNNQFDDKLSLQAPAKIKSGDKLPITLHTNSPQKVVIFAVDEGILQVSNYKLKDPLNSFLRKKALSVRTSQILDQILPEFRHLITHSAPGGDGDNDDVLSGHLNPFKRKIDEPVAYWSGIIDVNGNKTVEYQVPNYFNGKIRIMAVSVGEKTMGHTQMSTTVSNDIVLQPNAPYFAAPNDEFEVALNVTNLIENADDKATAINIDVTTTPHLSIIGESKKTIELANGKNGVLKFKFKANTQFGSADLHFTATAGKIKVEHDVSLSVRPLTEYRLTTMMGRMDGHKQIFTDLRDMFNSYSKRDALVSFSPFVLSKGLATYLQDYPHYCSEQILSRAIPVLVGGSYREFNLAAKEGITPLSELFQILQSRQNSEGAIGLWYSTYNVDPFITLYAVNFMLEAKDMGQAVPQKMLDNANQYLEKLATSYKKDFYNLRLRAYASYLLTRQDRITTSYLASILQDLNKNYNSSAWETDIIAMYIASSYKMLKMDKEANKILKPIWQEMSKAYDKAWWTHNYYDPLVINASNIHFISKHFPEKVKDIPAQALENMVLMLNKQKYTTQSAAMTILALSSYSSSIANAQLKPDSLQISATSKDTDKQRIIANLKGILTKGQFSEADKTLNVKNSTDYPAWYMISQQGYDKNIPNEPIKSGLEIYREYTDQNGAPIEQVKLGDKINVTVKVRAIADQGATNIAIVDLLPAGFEVVQQAINPEQKDADEDENEYDDQYAEDEDYDYSWRSPIALKTGGNTWYPEYTDVREDRVIIYGSTYNNKIQAFTYQIKATNIGSYHVPPAFGEAMYDRDIHAVSKGGSKIKVVPQQ